MDVHIFNCQKDLNVSDNSIEVVVKEVLLKEKVRCDEVSVHLVDAPAICKLHADYFNDPSLTDCISFPIDPPDSTEYCVLGEVFVCPKTAIDYAVLHQENPYKEATLYLVHGLLHLLGYDDRGEEEQDMRAAEKFHLENLEAHHLLLASN